MELRPMTEEDKTFVLSFDSHMDEDCFRNRVLTKTGFVLWEEENPVGLMHHCLLWDRMPFLNLLYIVEEKRGQGFGKKAMESWEAELKRRGCQIALLSTQADETAQHFYRKLGYRDCGGLIFQDTPFDQPAELFFRKVL